MQINLTRVSVIDLANTFGFFLLPTSFLLTLRNTPQLENERFKDRERERERERERVKVNIIKTKLQVFTKNNFSGM